MPVYNTSIHIYMHPWLATQISTDRHSQHTPNTNNTNILTLLPSLADQAEGLSVGNTSIQMYKVDPFQQLRSGAQSAQ